jgi:hypothetical protein
VNLSEHKKCVQHLRGKKNRKRVGGREKESPAGVRYLSASFYVNGTGADSFDLHGPLRLNQIGESIMIQP